MNIRWYNPEKYLKTRGDTNEYVSIVKASTEK